MSNADTPNVVHAITPSEAKEHVLRRDNYVPNWAMKIFNDAIVANLRGNFAIVDSDDLYNDLALEGGISVSEVLAHRWVGHAIDQYRAGGWRVVDIDRGFEFSVR